MGTVTLTMEFENQEGEKIGDPAYDSLAVNGYMMDSIISPVNIKGGSSAIMKIQLWQSDLEKNSIEDISDISQVEIGIQVMQGDYIIEETKLDMSI